MRVPAPAASRSFAEAVSRVNGVSFPDRASQESCDKDALAEDIRHVLANPQFLAWDIARQRAFLTHVANIYYTISHSSAGQIAPLVESILHRWIEREAIDLDGLLATYDFLYFLHWCAHHAIDEQRRFGDAVVRPVAAALSRLRPERRFADRTFGEPLRVGYLAQFCTSGSNALGLVAKDVMRALVRRPRIEPYLYAWCFHDQAFLDEITALGAVVRRIDSPTPAGRAEALSACLATDAVDVAVTDMNSAVPTCLFVQGCAPVQMYFQLGLPFWPVPRLDGVLLGWHAEPERLGFAGYPCEPISLPWDLATLAPPSDEAALAAERRRFPAETRLVGMYGRLAKVTGPYLDLCARLLARHPDLILAIGGSGDGAPLRNALAERGVADRTVLVDEFVDGHVWGRILHLFIDTWPLHGGISVRETLAKGTPVATVLSSDMPNLSRERDPALLASSPEELEPLVDLFLTDPAFREARRQAAIALAEQATDHDAFGAALEGAIGRAVARVAGRSAPAGEGG